ncbi:MAG TPA: HAD family phosphatase [Actinotalea sp.]|jgi:sugar-phosphatase
MPTGEVSLAQRLAGPSAGLLLDLDGTLLDSEPVHQAAFREYFAGRGWTVADDVVAQFAGRRAHEVFPVLDGPWNGEDPYALTEAVLDALRRTSVRPRPVAGAVELLAAASTTALPTVVVTSAGLDWTAPALEALGWPDLDAVTAEDCTHGKPDPEPYRRGVERLGLAPEGLVAVEDSPAGVASALAAGVGFVVGVTTGHSADALGRAHLLVPDLMLLARAVLAGRTQEGAH